MLVHEFIVIGMFQIIIINLKFAQNIRDKYFF